MRRDTWVKRQSRGSWYKAASPLKECSWESQIYNHHHVTRHRRCYFGLSFLQCNTSTPFYHKERENEESVLENYCNTTSPSVCNALPGPHAFTESDPTSAFWSDILNLIKYFNYFNFRRNAELWYRIAILIAENFFTAQL